jgi:hypothetical protein
MIVLATAPTVEELEKLINEYFYSENYRIENMKVYKLIIEIRGANTHTIKSHARGYIVRKKNGRFQFCADVQGGVKHGNCKM